MALQTLTARRGGNRGAVTKLLTKLQGIVDDATLDRDLKIYELDKKLQDLHSKIKLIQTLDDEIQNVTDAADVAAEIGSADVFNSNAFDGRDRAEFELLKLRQQVIDANAAVAAAAAATVAAAANLNRPPTVPALPVQTNYSNLPKFDLPEFDGSVLHWRAFWDVFEFEVHNKATYTGATKFNFLNSRLKGSAKAALSGLTPNNANYPKAIDILKDRFGQDKKIIAAHMRALYNMAKPGTDHVSLRIFSDQLESHIRGLDALGKKADSFGDLLVCILLDKFSPDLRRNLTRQHGTTEWTLEELQASIKRELEILDDSPAEQHSSKIPPAGVKKTNVFFAGASQPIKKKQRCAYCTGDHYASQCTSVRKAAERLKVAKVKKLCLNCLDASHTSLKDCPSKYRCKYCSKAHHSSLHPENSEEVSETPSVTSMSESISPSSTLAAAIHHSESSGKFTQPYVFLKTAIVETRFKGFKERANILIDEGSQRTFITSRLAKLLHLKPMWRESLLLSGFSMNPTGIEYYDVTQFFIVDLSGSLIKIKAIIIDHLVSPLDDPHRNLAASLPHLNGLQLAHPPSEATSFDVDILIGANFYWSLVRDKVIRGAGPTATESKIGYLLSGPLSASSVENESSDSVLTLHVSTMENFDLSKFWTVEGLGIQPELESDTTTNIYQSQCIEFRDNQYAAKLPWKSEHPELAPNFQVCHRRTIGTIKRVSKSPSQLAIYQKIISDQLDRGFIERVPPGEIYKRDCHYIPHFAIEKESATTPLRIVYDCSCKTSAGVSLNDCLETGPPLQNDMLEILLRFRVHRVGISADIEKAFHKVILHESDRDFFRFLWTSNISNPDADLEVYRFKVIPFGASCSPFILLSVIKHHLHSLPSLTAVDMDLNIYVDNLISGCDSTKEAVDYYAVSNSILNKAGLNLQSWSSNDQAINVRAVEDGVADPSTSSKILGLNWDRSTDSLSLPAFRLSTFIHATTTKRDILRGISTVFDPMGFFAPLTIAAKILNQELWKEKFDWDDPLPQKFRERFSKIAADIDNYHPVVPRCYLECRNDLQNLHLFVDASPHAFGAVAYFCNLDRVAFVLSKSRVAPLSIGKKPPTLPQLELIAALIGSTLANTIVKALKPLGISLTVTMWSDSQIVLYWLAQTARNKCQYVANRVDTIQKLSKDLQASWHYCPTKSNPADLLTRGISLRQFQQSSSLWIYGPTWLSSPEDWPSWETNKLNAVVLHLAESQLAPLISRPAIPPDSIDLFEVMDVSRYNWIPLLRVTSRILRYKSYFLPNRHPAQAFEFLTTAELRNAELIWIRAFQQRFLQDEYRYLRSRSGARPALVSQHDLFINDDDIICCKGRLQHARIKSSAKHPFLLPKSCDLTTLIILYHHKRMFHCGVDATCSSLRQRYWIPSIKQRVRSILRSCVICCRVSGKPYSAPDHAPLPAFRVSDAPPFTVVGVDYTGAYTIRGVSPKDDQKAYICLFTCASTRAIHLELVEDLSAQSFLLAFRRFVSHHSLPSMVISDNATNFECGADFITKIFRNPEVANYLTSQQVDWQFIPKRAPWYGGFWERLIGVTKIALSKMLGRTKPTFDELRTLVAEAEFVLNDRPIEKMSADSQTEEALTPSHLMYGRRFTSLPFDHTAAEEILNDPTFGEKPSILTKSAARLEKSLCAFRKHFTTNYLTALREYHKATRGHHEEIVKIGDVVLVHDESPRHHWKLAVIENLIKSNDGHVRAAEIRTASGKTNRPISKLYPLEVSESTETIDIQQSIDSPPEQIQQPIDSSPEQIQPIITSRPVRRAATKANQLIKQMTMDEPEED